MTKEEMNLWARTTRALTGRYPIGAKVVSAFPLTASDFHGEATVIAHVELTGEGGLLLELQNGVHVHELTEHLMPA